MLSFVSPEAVTSCHHVACERVLGHISLTVRSPWFTAGHTILTATKAEGQPHPQSLRSHRLEFLRLAQFP